MLTFIPTSYSTYIHTHVTTYSHLYPLCSHLYTLHFPSYIHVIFSLHNHFRFPHTSTSGSHIHIFQVPTYTHFRFPHTSTSGCHIHPLQVPTYTHCRLPHISTSLYCLYPHHIPTYMYIYPHHVLNYMYIYLHPMFSHITNLGDRLHHGPRMVTNCILTVYSIPCCQWHVHIWT